MVDRHGPYRNFRYRLELGYTEEAAFSECTIPESSTEAIEYRNGNEQPTVRKLQGLNTYGNITLQRGVTESMALFDWWKLVEDGFADDARQDVAIIVLNEEGEDTARYEFRLAWPRQYDAPDLNATANEVAIENLEIVHEGMVRVT